MKHIIRYALLIIVLFNLNIKSYAYDFTVDGIYYNVTSFTDMTCSVTSGDIGYAGDITIPANVTYNNRTLAVTSIGDDAFSYCSGLTGVTIPNSVTRIGNSAFCYCSGLTGVTIPNSVTSIGGSAFRGCSGLTNMTIPNSVTRIGGSAFSGCSGLTNMTIPNSVTSIGDDAFSGCSGLTSITIPNSVTWIGNSAFYGCSGLTSITIPNSVTSIGDSAFYGCSGLTSITIPNSVTSIGSSTFYGCSGLTNMNIPNSVKSIGEYTFCDCSGLTSITISNSVTSIGNYAFIRTSNIKSLVMDDGGLNLQLGYNKYIDNSSGLFASCPLEYVYIGRNLNYKAGIYYGHHPFYECKKSITEIAFSKYITKIPDYTKDFSELETITLYNSTPPSISFTFTNAQYMNMNIYVPKGSLEAYQKADVWKNFWGLQEKDLTGIETIVADDCNTDSVIYDMQGRRLDAPKAGLNIINGKKVMIRK